MAQYAGRIHRNRAGKTAATAYDYADVYEPMLEGQYRKSLHEYTRLGHEVPSSDGAASEHGARQSLFYDADTYDIGFLTDLEVVATSVDMAAPYAALKRVAHLAKRLQRPAEAHASVRVRLESIDADSAYADENLRTIDAFREAGTTAELTGNGTKLLCIAVLDRRIAWQGDINVLHTTDTTRRPLGLRESW